MKEGYKKKEHRVIKLVLPVAGLGKRLRPLTLTTPKNLLAVGGKPLIEYALDEAAASGIREVILIVSPTHRRAFEGYLTKRRDAFPALKFHIREQKVLGGDGHAVLEAYDLIRGECFAVRFCDDVIVSAPPVLRSLISLFSAVDSPVILLERLPEKLISLFGVVKVKSAKKLPAHVTGGGKVHEILDIVEKPQREKAPSNLTIVGGYVFTPRVMDNLYRVAKTLPAVGEDALRLATALEIDLLIGERIYGLEFKGIRLDCGNIERLRRADEFLRKLPSRIAE